MSRGGLAGPSLVVSAVVVQIITYAYRPTLAYAALDAGGVAALLGVMSAIFAVPALLLAIPVGRMVDRIGERRLAVVGACLMVASLAVALLGSGSFSALLVATLVLGVAHLCTIIGQQTLAANRSRPGGSDAAFGWYTLAASVGQALGPLLLAIPGATALRPPIELIFAICLALCMPLLLSAFGMRAEVVRATAADAGGAWSTALANVRRRGALRALVAGGIAVATVDITLVYWPALGEERGLAPAVVSAMLVARALATMASRGLLGWSTARWGRRRVMVVTLAAAAVALAATALPLPAVALVVTASAYGLGVGVCQPIAMSWLSSLAPPGQRGAILSLRLVGNRFAQASIPALAGLLAAPLGSAAVIVVLAGALGVATWAGAAVPNSER